MTEQDLVVDALKTAKTVVNEHFDNIGMIVETIGVLKFLIKHVKDEDYKTALMSVSVDLMFLAMAIM